MNARPSNMFRALPISAAVLVVLGVAAESSAALPPGVLLKKPNVLLVVETSSHMLEAIDGSPMDCSNGDKGRYTMVAEALTGTISDLECGDLPTNGLPGNPSRRVAVQSNACRPVLNGDFQPAAYLRPYAWPERPSNKPKKDKDAIAFCPKNNNKYDECEYGSWSIPKGEICEEGKNGQWEQTQDGLIDTFTRGLRFGLVTTDPLSVTTTINPLLAKTDFVTYPATSWKPINGVLGAPEYGGPDNCQMATNGSRCQILGAFASAPYSGTDLYPNGETRQYSYWFEPSVVSAGNWTAGTGKGAYTNVIVTNDPILNVDYTTAETNIDIGVRNPNARPDEGRMIGFGAPTWDVSNPGLTGCANEDECTSHHNDMVQAAILAAPRWLEPGEDLQGNFTAPLGAMMRDTYEFLLKDNTTVGVYVPHAETYDPGAALPNPVAGVIGGKGDPDFPGCRQGAVVLITSGLSDDDIDETPAYYAALLQAAPTPIPTYVVGMVQDTGFWWNDGGGAFSWQWADCNSMSFASDFGSGDMCERMPSPNDTKFVTVENGFNQLWGVSPKIEACCNVLEVAGKGGTTPYFAADGADLKQDLNQIMSASSGTILSRTHPVFAQAPTAFVSAVGAPGGPNVTSVPRNFYEIRTSVQVTANDTIWRGHIDRVRYACDTTTFTSTIQTVNRNLGDVFEDNINRRSQAANRRFFTAIPLDSGGFSARRMGGTIRPQTGAANPNATDGLFNGTYTGDFKRVGGNTSLQDDQFWPIDTLQNDIDGSGAGLPKADEMMDIGCSWKDTCRSLVGSGGGGGCGGGWQRQCADRVLGWYGGQDNPGGGTLSRLPTSANCPNSSTCSALGGIYKSSPIIVPPPEPFESDDQNFGRNETAAGDLSFVQTHAKRPTMLYQQTTDGMLHAFVIDKNDYSDPDNPDFDSSVPPGTLSVPTVESRINNELWSFIPPAVFPHILGNFNNEARFTDGQLAYGEVVFQRQYGTNAGISSVGEVDWQYRTVMVVASGPSALGGFYYAMDITEPNKPKFLWQISTAGNDPAGTGDPGDALFGSSAPGALITHVRFKEPGTGVTKVVAVAVLPGGNPATGASGVRDRRLDPTTYWTGTNRVPRSRIKDWPGAQPSRSLTFVELSSGRILARLTGDPLDNPSTLSTNVTTDFVAHPNYTPFDSPITGIPVAYPAGGIKVADWIYVGDADGTMWQVDVSNVDVEEWKARIAFDLYNQGSAGQATLKDAFIEAGPGAGTQLGSQPQGGSTADQAAVLGQPIQNQPLTSVDESGNLVISVASGDQEEFATVSPGAVTIAASFPMKPRGGVLYPPFQASLSATEGMEMAFLDGGRVTGALNLFDGQLYYAYFTPSPLGGCNPGGSGMCGVSYNKRTGFRPDGLVDLGEGTSSAPDRCVSFVDDVVVFGISINIRPSCTDPGLVDSNNDQWLAGQYQSVSQSNLGQYELAFHTGSGGTPKNNSKTPSATLTLPTPKSKTRVRTWVSVVE